jgi:hypothetical protein
MICSAAHILAYGNNTEFLRAENRSEDDSENTIKKHCKGDCTMTIRNIMIGMPFPTRSNNDISISTNFIGLLNCSDSVAFFFFIILILCQSISDIFKACVIVTYLTA